ncbi:MAG: O-antigen ligase family protein [Bacteroidota bacterium]|nr:O-antigen ligase family protein [Bacteroidota bacterium]
MWNKVQNDWRKQLIFCSILAMLVGLFFSRATLSIGVGAFIVCSLFHKKVPAQVLNFFSTPLLWGMSLLFLLPMLSGLWSTDKQEWAEMMRIKLPLFFLPVAFAAPFNFSINDWKRITFIFLVFITGATFYSLWYYLSEAKQVHIEYLQSRLMLTALENDHVRFSWLVSIAVVLTTWLFFTNKNKSPKWVRYFLAGIATWLIIYLHILAARTGLLCLYTMAFLSAIWFLIKERKKNLSAVLFISLIVLPVISFFIFPTFQNRVKYFLYDLSYFRKAEYLPGSNDGTRMLSIKAGWNVLNEHPVSGAGFGDILSNTHLWYEKNYPQMIETDKIYPSSEWLMYGSGCGWPGFLLFTFMMILPFFTRHSKNNLSWLLVNISVILIFLFDIGLEVQYGIFLYSFIVLAFWKYNTETLIEPLKHNLY